MIGWIVILLLKVVAATLIFFLAVGWFQNFHPAFDSFSHFRQLVCVALILVTGLLVFLAPWFWAAASAVTVIISLSLSYPYLPYLGPVADNIRGSGNTLKIMQFNLRFNNDDITAMAAAILSEEADLVLVQELTPLNFSILDRVKERFPYQLECNSRSRGSVGLLSRHPFAVLGKQDCLRKLGFIHARLQIGTKEITIAGFHSKWPWPRRQHFQIGALEEIVSDLQKPLILAGDFNSAPWSAAVQRVARLSQTQVVTGSLLSWRPVFKSRGFSAPLMLSLDQIMASEDLIPVARRRLQDGGSDHLPILTEFVWREDVQAK